ncbi:hypothetical protein HYQ44_001478 [Verticillium longisporum]|nr:hypothetical protein HYQ44_001478 [Verticillium longisporum]
MTTCQRPSMPIRQIKRCFWTISNIHVSQCANLKSPSEVSTFILPTHCEHEVITPCYRGYSASQGLLHQNPMCSTATSRKHLYNLTLIGPRLLVAWPAGNSGVVSFFQPLDGANGTLSINLVNSSTSGNSLDPIYEVSDQVESLSFLSYKNKLLAGGWRFLTYFGRDSMISMLLMEKVLSTGDGGTFKAGIGAVLERINRTDGSAAHEEGIGDFATWFNLQRNISSTAPSYDYHMIDTDYFLPVLLRDYFLNNSDGRERVATFMSTEATIDPDNDGLTYHDLALVNAEKIMNATAAFAGPGGQIRDNLIHLKEGEITGEWRDSTYGLGGGRIPYNVNAAIAPAGLRAIAALSEASFFPEHPEWAEKAAAAAQIWEDETLRFFEVTIEQEEARALLNDYVDANEFSFPSQADGINSSVTFYGLALKGNNDIDLVRVMNSDDGLRHFLLNTTNQTQLSSYLSQTADHILQPFPAGLTTNIGLLVANPAYGGKPVYSANFTTSAYHGTVKQVSA